MSTSASMHNVSEFRRENWPISVFRLFRNPLQPEPDTWDLIYRYPHLRQLKILSKTVKIADIFTIKICV